jgi:hypothetical protein
LPLAISSAPWSSSNGFRLVTVQYPDRILSSSFASLKSLSRQNLASRPKPIGSSLGLLFPTALSGSEVHLTRACQPATFRLQGLITLLTAYSLRSLAGFVSHRQHSWDSPFGGFSSRKVFEPFETRMDPPTVSPSVVPSTVVPGRPNGSRFLGFDPSGSSWQFERVFDPPIAGSSHGFDPSRVLRQKPWRGFRPASSHALFSSGNHSPNESAPQSIDRLSLSLIRLRGFRPTHGSGDPFRVSAPARSHVFG